MISYQIFPVGKGVTWEQALKDASNWEESLPPRYKIISIASEKQCERFSLDEETGEIKHTYDLSLVVYYIKY
jgi:N-acetylglucosamine-6-phosphate deacetylase